MVQHTQRKRLLSARKDWTIWHRCKLKCRAIKMHQRIKRNQSVSNTWVISATTLCFCRCLRRGAALTASATIIIRIIIMLTNVRFEKTELFRRGKKGRTINWLHNKNQRNVHTTPIQMRNVPNHTQRYIVNTTQHYTKLTLPFLPQWRAASRIDSKRRLLGRAATTTIYLPEGCHPA